uniref:Uncharacterized protein n=1 Tax=Rhizophora mucronata TaxID=61149 RepID=A0A2P2QK10_RHIMU
MRIAPSSTFYCLAIYVGLYTCTALLAAYEIHYDYSSSFLFSFNFMCDLLTCIQYILGFFISSSS